METWQSVKHHVFSFIGHTLFVAAVVIVVLALIANAILPQKEGNTADFHKTWKEKSIAIKVLDDTI